MINLPPILLIEDDLNEIESILENLRAYNFANELVVVGNCREALDFLYYHGKYENRSKGNPILILLDVKILKLDGSEALQKIKTDANLKHIPVVILISSNEDKAKLDDYKIEIDTYVKPFNFHRFVDSINKFRIFWLAINKR
jgi:CheY-like chemotaxis protein